MTHNSERTGIENKIEAKKRALEVKIGDLIRAKEISNKIINELEIDYKGFRPEMKIKTEKTKDYSKEKPYNKKTIFCIGFGKNIPSLYIAGYARAFTERIREHYNKET